MNQVGATDRSGRAQLGVPKSMRTGGDKGEEEEEEEKQRSNRGSSATNLILALVGKTGR